MFDKIGLQLYYLFKRKPVVDIKHFIKLLADVKLQNEFQPAEPEWPSGLQRRACSMDGCRFELQTSTNACRHICRYMDRKGSAAMLTSIQSAGVIPEVNLRNSLHTGDKAHNRGIHPGFETQGRHRQKSKTGVSVAPRKGLYVLKKCI